METVVGSFEAKTHLSSLLERVSRGERITITKHGVPIALLVPVDSVPGRDRNAVIDQLKAFGRGRTLPKGVTIRDLIEEGRRF
jgi:prevent-host-death family protein